MAKSESPNIQAKCTNESDVWQTGGELLPGGLALMHSIERFSFSPIYVAVDARSIHKLRL